jgi:hypothetical protein
MEKYPGWLNVNDTYKIKKDLYELKLKIEEIEMELSLFLGNRKNVTAGMRAKKKILSLREEDLRKISKKITKMKQDYKSDYS